MRNKTIVCWWCERHYITRTVLMYIFGMIWRFFFVTFCARFCSRSLRRLSLVGHSGRANEVVYAPPTRESTNGDTVVFFGGDVQDFQEAMLTHRDNSRHAAWCLENVARLLGDAFPSSHVIVVRPKKMEYRTFSCFENFVPCGNCGVPEHVPNHGGLEHLEALLGAVAIATDTDVHDRPIRLIGFSKGCVVLNQFLHEFHDWSARSTPPDVIGRIKQMYWLDGGHCGGKNTWITNQNIIKSFAALDISVHIHVTPYQIDDDRRPWIRKEERLFFNTLTQFQVNVNRIVHFKNQVPDIEMHFSVLKRLNMNTSS